MYPKNKIALVIAVVLIGVGLLGYLALQTKESPESANQYIKALESADSKFVASEYDEAIEEYKRVKELADTEDEKRLAVTRLAAAYMQKGDYLTSRELFVAAEEEFGDEWLAITEGLASSYFGLQDFNKAASYYEKSIEIAKSDAIVSDNKKQLVENYQSQAKAAKEHDKNLPYSKQAALHLGRANSYEAREDKLKAIEEYEAAKELMDHDDSEQHDYVHEIEEKIEALKA